MEMRKDFLRFHTSNGRPQRWSLGSFQGRARSVFLEDTKVTIFKAGGWHGNSDFLQCLNWQIYLKSPHHSASPGQNKSKSRKDPKPKSPPSGTAGRGRNAWALTVKWKTHIFSQEFLSQVTFLYTHDNIFIWSGGGKVRKSCDKLGRNKRNWTVIVN